MAVINIDEEIENMNKCLEKLQEHFQDIQDLVPESDTVQSYVSVVTTAAGRMVAHVKDLREARDTLEAQVDKIGDTLDEKDTTVKRLEGKTDTLIDNNKKLTASLAQTGINVTQTAPGTFLCERQDGVVEFVNIPTGVNILEAKSTVWDPEKEEYLVCFNAKGFRIPVAYFKKIWEIENPTMIKEKRLKQKLREEIQEESNKRFVQATRGMNAKWGDVEKGYEIFTGQFVPWKTLHKRHERALEEVKN